MPDPVERRLALQASRHEAFGAHVVELLAPFTGRERALDVGCGTGALAFVLAEHVGEVVGVDEREAYVEAARATRRQAVPSPSRTPPRCRSRTGTSTSSAAPACFTTFGGPSSSSPSSHASRGQAAGSSSSTSSGTSIRSGVMELDRFERVRDPTHSRLLPDADIRGYLDANDLTVVANTIAPEHRDVETYLDIVGLEGEARERVARMAPESYDVELGWYVAVKHG